MSQPFCFVATVSFCASSTKNYITTFILSPFAWYFLFILLPLFIIFFLFIPHTFLHSLALFGCNFVSQCICNLFPFSCFQLLNIMFLIQLFSINLFDLFL